MLRDYEAAWHELAAFIEGKPHHGSRDLLAEMQRISNAPDVRVNESGLARSLRLYGVEVDLQALRSAVERDGAPDAGGGSPAPGDGGSPRPSPTHDPEGGHDGNDDRTAEAGRPAARAAA